MLRSLRKNGKGVRRGGKEEERRKKKRNEEEKERAEDLLILSISDFPQSSALEAGPPHQQNEGQVAFRR